VPTASRPARSGYQEILTDPSYSRQIVTLTYPHIGNTGVNAEDVEADRIHAAGLVVRDLPRLHSNFRASQSLPDYLKGQNIVAIADIDTRRLTRVLREKGAQSGCIMAGAVDEAKALEAAHAFPGLAGMDLAKVVSASEAYEWSETEWKLGHGYGQQAEPRFHVVAFDYGVKRNILRMLAERGCRLTVLPATATSADALALKPDGIFLSNGPGDPEPCDYAIRAIGELVAAQIPTFGICLGHQLLALASGARTTKMKFGHHGANHPVKDLDSGAGGWRSPARTTALRWTPQPCRPTCAARTSPCLTARCRASHAPTHLRSAFRGIPKPVLARTT